MGTIAGTVSAELVNDLSCTSGSAVYVFEGAVDPNDVDDVEDVDPIASALVELNGETGAYQYRVAFLLAGPYTVAFTCNAGDDDPVTDDDNVSFLAVTGSRCWRIRSRPRISEDQRLATGAQ